MKRQTKIVIAVLLLLSAGVAVLVLLNAPPALGSGTLTITRAGTVLHTYTMEEIAAFPYIDEELEIASAGFGDERGLFRAVPLRALLDAVDPALLQEAKHIVVRAEDAFSAAYRRKEVAQSDNIRVAYLKNGKALGTLQDGGSGPLRIVIQKDAFGTRSARFLLEVEVR